jgi:hypothetical protein
MCSATPARWTTIPSRKTSSRRAVRFVIEDEEELLSFFKIKERSFWPKIRITNATKR